MALGIKFLGTAAAEAWPAVFCMCESCRRAQSLGGKNLRLRTNTLINNDLLVDLSADFSYFKMKYDIDILKLKTILFTHTHLDHFFPQLFGYNISTYSENPVKIQVLCSPYAAGLIAKTNFDKLSGLENFEILPVTPYNTYQINGYTITPIEAAHNAPQSLLYIISRGGINYLYGNDTAMLYDNVLEFLEGKKLHAVSLDATMGRRETKHGRHLSFKEVIELKEHFFKRGICDKDTRFIATHFTHHIDMTHEQLEKYFSPHGIIPAYDGMEIFAGSGI